MSQDPKPSGTVVVLRDGSEALELLLLQRSPRKGKPGPWVFPGGKVEHGDRREGAPPVEEARIASVREAREEAGLALSAESLVHISRWITPSLAPRRFDTWFFLARVDPDARVQVDGQEICDHRWMSPGDALDAHHQTGSAVRLAPPTFVTVCWLDGFPDAAAALAELGGRERIDFHPRIARTEQGACMLYPGDAGYEATDPDRGGRRHRLWAREDGWRYEWDEPC